MNLAELEKRRDELSARFTELQWDLGGMTYEMASREHFRLDVLNAHAAKLQQVDVELAQVEQVLRLDQAGAAGTCPACGALHPRGAVFCSQCGEAVTSIGTGAPSPGRAASAARRNGKAPA